MSESQGTDGDTIDRQVTQTPQAIDVPGMGDQPAIVEGKGLPSAHDAADKMGALPGQMEQTRTNLSETIDAGQERLSPEHVVEQAQETARGTARNPFDRARETMRAAASGNVAQMVSSARDTAKTAAGSARDTAKTAAASSGDVAKTVAGTAGDVAKTVVGIAGDVVKLLMLPAGVILAAGGLVLGLIAGLFLGLLRNKTARSGAGAREGQMPAPPEPHDGARRARQIGLKRR